MPTVKEVPVEEATALGEITVLVTGYGPFLEDVKINPSWSIASTLPTVLSPTPTCPYFINLQIPSEPLTVAYNPVIKALPNLLEPPVESGLSKPDLILHIGLAAGREFYTLERLSVGGTYDSVPDVEGKTLAPELREALFKGCPRVLRPTFDTKDLWRRWRDNVTDHTADLRPSDDPGGFLCGFIYYLSMAHFYQLGKDVERPVMFLHVPNLQSDQEIAQGREVAVGMIRAIVASKQKLGKMDPLKGGEYVWEEKIDSAWSGVRA